MNKNEIITKIQYFKVKGLTCHNCESRVTKALLQDKSVLHAQADYVRGTLILKTRGEGLNEEEVNRRLEGSGYTAAFMSRAVWLTGEILPLLIAAVVLFLLYISASKTGIMNRIPEIKESMSYPVLFVVGIMTSVHCLGMCGGINLSQTSRGISAERKSIVFRRGLLYNLGRLVSYTVIGGIVGGLGSVLSVSLSLQGIIISAAGLIMIIMGFNMIGLFTPLKKLVPVLPAGLAEKLYGAGSGRGPFIVGLLNGFMPCGPLQSMQLYALSTASVLKGAFSMFLFSAGTIPLMLAFGTLSALFSKRLQRNVLRISALMVLFLGAGMIGRGMSLSGLTLSTSAPVPDASGKINAAVAEIQGDEQIVISDVSPYAYEPIIVQAGIPVKWYLEAGQNDIGGCNNAIAVRRYDIQQSLSVGRTLVEFTPDESGIVPFSCWMGMINSRIVVVDDLTDYDPSLVDAPPPARESVQSRIIVPEYSLEDIAFPDSESEEPVMTMTLTESGYSPPVMVMKKGQIHQWTFVPETVTDKNFQIIFPAYQSKIEVTGDENVVVPINPEVDFYFVSSQGDYLGFVIVVENPEELTKQDVLDTVNIYLESF